MLHYGLFCLCCHLKLLYTFYKHYFNFLGEDFTNRIGTIVGWGRVGVEKSSSKVLLKASLRILSDEDCMNSQLAQHLKPTMMCAFSKGKDGCQVCFFLIIIFFIDVDYQ